MFYQYYCPVHFMVGDNALGELPALCSGGNVLLIYGGGSLKASGAYDLLVKLITDGGSAVFDYGGVCEPNIEAVKKGIDLCRENNIKFVVGAGGAVVMDTAKAIAFCTNNHDWELYITGQKKAENRHMPLILIPTYPSSGSEADGFSDIRDANGEEYGGFSNVFADYALLIPELTASLDRETTAYSALVTFVQLGVSYFGNTDSLVRKMTACIMRSVLESYNTLLEHPDDSDARLNVLWASSLATMGVLNVGLKDRRGMRVYEIGYILRCLQSMPYREAMTIVWPRWFKGAAGLYPEEARNFITEVFGIDASLDDRRLLQEGLKAYGGYVKKGSLPEYVKADAAPPSNEEIDGYTWDELLEAVPSGVVRQMVRECFAPLDPAGGAAE